MLENHLELLGGEVEVLSWRVLKTVVDQSLLKGGQVTLQTLLGQDGLFSDYLIAIIIENSSIVVGVTVF